MGGTGVVTTGPGERGGGDGLHDPRPRGRAARAARALRAAAPKGRPPHDLVDRLAVVVTQALGVQGASVSALFAPGMSVPVGVSDPLAARAEQLQFTAGEGPCWEAYLTGTTVVADLADAAASQRRWPAYARALRHETGYQLVVALPVTLASGLVVALSTYEADRSGGAWWLDAVRVGSALGEVLDEASPPASEGGAVWLDSSTTARRSTVWTAEAVLIDNAPFLDHDRALDALRTYSLSEGTTVDDTAAALVEGRLTTREVLGR
ncbi:hypothetical protein [Quadrisphaera setariae]|uniref:GAF domain-containing protein n=1 Tax=Quadrisphaera setariae TaxID=2593304 RepID=A0A5C8ZGT4_9ACTN|nr:hypothetical protein [Quadrisphaera setariae]TXR56096.1 hypothetical protein FMM08_11730 [Quadrisphaera setariae]